MLEKIAQILNGSSSKVTGVMKNALKTKVRPGNTKTQTTTGKTANSIGSKVPNIIGGVLNWVFTSNESAVRLNNGGSLKTKGSFNVPYSGRGGGGQSDYIGALMIWVADKFPEKSEYEQKRMVFKVAGAAKDRGRTVKSPGWLDDAKKEIDRMINDELNAAIALVVNQKVNKALKLK